jgi:hypothetical protein
MTFINSNKRVCVNVKAAAEPVDNSAQAAAETPGSAPMRHQDKVQMETGFLVLVIPGPDPGIASIDGAGLDPRIRSGDDDGGAVRPPKASPTAPLS